MSYNAFIVVLIGILFGNTVASILPYGCVECNQKGFIYCRSGVSPNEQYNCRKSVDSCAATSDQIVGQDLCPNVPPQCAEHNYDCPACVGTVGCQMCASTGEFCMPTTAPCLDTVVATNLAGCSTANYLSMDACNDKTDCASCVSTSGCYYIPDKSLTPFPKGCSSINSTMWNAVKDCSDPTVVCPLRTSGTPSDMCNCSPDITDVKCTLCFGEGPTTAETNYKCTERLYPDCEKVSNDCHNANLTCPPLINRFDPYGTRANCLTNDQCSICITKPVSSITPSTLKCVSTISNPSTCSALTRDAADPKIICPTRLTCTDCASTSGCSWCDSSDLLFSSSCAATGNCGTNQVANNTCGNDCSSFKTCNTCPTDKGCSWCANSEFGLQRCVKECATTTQQKIINCAQANRCSPHNDDCQGCITDSCTYCNGNGRNDGGNPGNWCSNVTNCNNVAGCGEWEPCLAVPVSSTANCKASFCTQYKDCISCAGQTDEIQHCYWCDNGGKRYCDAGCNGTATRVSNCAVFGPTTGGLPTGTSGQTGSPSTGSNGIPPPSPAPSPSPTTGPAPGGPSPNPKTPSPTTSPTPGGTSPTPNPNTPSPTTDPAPGGPSPTPNPKTPSSSPQPDDGGPEPSPGGGTPSPSKGFVNSFSWMLGVIFVVLVYMGYPL